MQDSSPRALSSLAVWLNRRFGGLPPEQVQDLAACTWLFSAVLWSLVGMALGMIEAIKLIFPHLLGGVDVLSFGRLRPAHVNTIIFGWLTMGVTGAALYMIPRLAQRRLYLGELAVLMGLLYNVIVAASIFLLMWGFTKGKEYEEWIRPLNIGVLFCINVVAVCLLLTLLKRQHEKLYVTVWYVILGFVGFDISYISGNFPIYYGAEDASINWFYAEALLGLWLIGGGVGILYYVIPKYLNKKLFWHQLALWGFWLFAAFYAWNGGRRLIYAPVPELWPMLGILFTLSWALPVLVINVTWFGTFWGRWRELLNNVPLRFAALAGISYFLSSYEASVEAYEYFNANQHFSDFKIAYTHLSFAGFTTPAVVALIYFMLEKGLNRRLSPFLTSAHWWLFFIGLWMFVIPIQVAGFLEGQVWASHLPFAQSVLARSPYYWARTFSGYGLAGGQFLFAWNIIWALLQNPDSTREGALRETMLPEGTEAAARGQVK